MLLGLLLLGAAIWGCFDSITTLDWVILGISGFVIGVAAFGLLASRGAGGKCMIWTYTITFVLFLLFQGAVLIGLFFFREDFKNLLDDLAGTRADGEEITDTDNTDEETASIIDSDIFIYCLLGWVALELMTLFLVCFYGERAIADKQENDDEDPSAPLLADEAGRKKNADPKKQKKYDALKKKYGHLKDGKEAPKEDVALDSRKATPSINSKNKR